MHFPVDLWCWASFHVLIGHLYIFFGEMSFSLAHFLIASVVLLLLSCKISVWVLDTSLFSDNWFAGMWLTVPSTSVVVKTNCPAISYEGSEHPWIWCVWEGPATGLPWIPRDACIYLLCSCLYFLDVMTQMFFFEKSGSSIFLMLFVLWRFTKEGFAWCCLMEIYFHLFFQELYSFTNAFRSVVCFELVFVYGVRYGLTFFCM